MLNISIIIPICEEEEAHYSLVGFFESLNDNQLEIIVSKGSSRAHAMNRGAEQAKNTFLWFLHADTKLEKVHVQKLQQACANHPDKLHYFDLKFSKDGSFISFMNAWGANLRSRIFGIPWGDQGLCCSRDIFKKLGGYDESVAYGEDHLLVWAAHHEGIKISPLKIAITTSAREYKKKGWLSLTLKRQYLWTRQAFPQLWTLLKIKMKKR